MVRVPSGRARSGPLPLVSPSQLAALCEAEARWLAVGSTFEGDVRYRLLWSLLAETGMRLGEALSIQHRDWTMGTGQTAVVRVVVRPHPHHVAAKGGSRSVHVSNRLDRLYGEFVWQLCDLGADVVIDDWDSVYVFCNLQRRPMFGPAATRIGVRPSRRDEAAGAGAAGRVDAALVPPHPRHSAVAGRRPSSRRAVGGWVIETSRPRRTPTVTSPRTRSFVRSPTGRSSSPTGARPPQSRTALMPVTAPMHVATIGATPRLALPNWSMMAGVARTVGVAPGRLPSGPLRQGEHAGAIRRRRSPKTSSGAAWTTQALNIRGLPEVWSGSWPR